MRFRDAVFLDGMLLVLVILVKDDWIVRRDPALPCMPASSLHVAGPGFRRFECERTGPVSVTTFFQAVRKDTNKRLQVLDEMIPGAC